MTAKAIVLVGHCGPDMMMLRTAMGRLAGDVPVLTANDSDSLARVSSAGHVLLVNRVLDGEFGTGSGIELIGRLATSADGNAPVMMLISNYADSQAQAVQAGAVQGFGKSELYEARTKERVQAALTRAAAALSSES